MHGRQAGLLNEHGEIIRRLTPHARLPGRGHDDSLPDHGGWHPLGANCGCRPLHGPGIGILLWQILVALQACRWGSSDPSLALATWRWSTTTYPRSSAGARGHEQQCNLEAVFQLVTT